MATHMYTLNTLNTLTFKSFSIMENKPPRALQSRSAATTEFDESMAAGASGAAVFSTR